MRIVGVLVALFMVCGMSFADRASDLQAEGQKLLSQKNQLVQQSNQISQQLQRIEVRLIQIDAILTEYNQIGKERGNEEVTVMPIVGE